MSFKKLNPNAAEFVLPTGAYRPFTPAVEAPPPIRVIVVVGYGKQGRTTLAKRIADHFQYEYVNVGKKDSNANCCCNLTVRFAPLVKCLESNTLKGIVIDDAVQVSRYDPYYIAHILEKKKLSFNAIVMVNTPVKPSERRFANDIDKQSNPDSFEFCFSVENDTNGDAIIVLDGTATVEQIVSEALGELGSLASKPPIKVALPPVHLIRNCTPLVKDPEFVEKVIRAETEALELPLACEYLYHFPFVQPNYILDYSLFSKTALLFKSYLVVPWIWGAKISLIGYDGSVYAHIPYYQLLFDVSSACSELLRLSKTLPSNPNKLTFSLEAVLKANIIYISDMMYFGGESGSTKLLRERVDILKKKIKLNDSSFVLLPYYVVSNIQKCLKHTAASGVLFINPDGMTPGTYDSRNIAFYHAEQKRVPLRLWNGAEIGENWHFDLYASSHDKEEAVEKSKVVISRSVVDSFVLNDGHIVECEYCSKKRQFKFITRSHWEATPVASYFLEAILKTKESPEIYLKACSAIKCDPLIED